MKSDIEFAKAWTQKLEALGIVLGNSKGEYFVCLPCHIGSSTEATSNGPLHPHPGRGRKRVYQSAAKRQRAYRYRSKSRTVTK